MGPPLGGGGGRGGQVAIFVRRTSAPRRDTQSSAAADSTLSRRRHAACRTTRNEAAGSQALRAPDCSALIRRPSTCRCCHQRNIGATTTATRRTARCSPTPRTSYAHSARRRARSSRSAHTALFWSACPLLLGSEPLLSRRRGGARTQTRCSSWRRASARAPILGGAARFQTPRCDRYRWPCRGRGDLRRQLAAADA